VATGWASLPEEAKTGIARATLEAIGVKPEKEALSDAITGIDDLVKEGRSITEALQELGLEDEQIAKIVGGGTPEPKAAKPPGPSAKETEPSNVGREDLDRVHFRNRVNSHISNDIRPTVEGKSGWDNVQVDLWDESSKSIDKVKIPADQFTEEGLWKILVDHPKAHFVQLTDPDNKSLGRIWWVLEAATPKPPGPSRVTGAK
jgi:hypothetical protein